MKAPWIKSAYSFGQFYLIPNMDSIVVGGTSQRDNWSTDESASDTDDILAGVCDVFPSLRTAPVVSAVHSSYNAHTYLSLILYWC